MQGTPKRSDKVRVKKDAVLAATQTEGLQARESQMSLGHCCRYAPDEDGQSTVSCPAPRSGDNAESLALRGGAKRLSSGAAGSKQPAQPPRRLREPGLLATASGIETQDAQSVGSRAGTRPRTTMMPAAPSLSRPPPAQNKRFPPRFQGSSPGLKERAEQKAFQLRACSGAR